MRALVKFPNGSSISYQFTTEHPASSYGLGVLVRQSNPRALLDGSQFRIQRDEMDAVLFTDEPEKVCGALGVPLDAPRYAGGKGELHNRAKLTAKQVQRIRLLHAQGHTYTSLAEKYGVTNATISAAVRA